jgi:hypothetical protein
MFQFKKEATAVRAAKLLASREAKPIHVMVCAAREIYSIGLPTNAAVRGAGTHVAIVYESGNVAKICPMNNQEQHDTHPMSMTRYFPSSTQARPLVCFD